MFTLLRKKVGYFGRASVARSKRGNVKRLGEIAGADIHSIERTMYKVGDEDIRVIQDKLNYIPRKRLGFKAPADLLRNHLSALCFKLQADLLK